MLSIVLASRGSVAVWEAGGTEVSGMLIWCERSVISDDVGLITSAFVLIVVACTLTRLNGVVAVVVTETGSEATPVISSATNRLERVVAVLMETASDSASVFGAPR